MNISFINYIEDHTVVTYDYLWISLKSYIEDNYKGDISWKWNYPHKNAVANSADELVEKVVSENPDILLVSLYVWNHGLSVAVAEKVKERLPECIVMFGGPHLLHESDQSYFKKNWFVDFLCASDAYGEVFMNEFLYQLETDKDWSQVPFLIMPNDDREGYFKSKKYFNKRTFNWPKNIYERNEDYFQHILIEKKRTGYPMYMIYESSRGCPFGCTYCEWGGGISSKTNFKPDDLVFEDLDFIFEVLRPELFSFTDANFGIVPRDVDIAEKLCEYKDEIGVPQQIYLYGPTKVRKENLYKIEKMFAERKIMNGIKIPVQDLNDVVHQNIKRTDDHWEKQMEEYQKMREEVGDLIIALELILGLPGADLNSYYDSLTAAKKHNVGMIRYEWYMLPTAPAADPKYIEEFKIETMHIKPNISVNNTMVRQNIESINRIKKNEGPTSLISTEEFVEPMDIVVSTYSYDREDWIEMWFTDKIVYMGEIKQYFKPISDYMEKEKGVTIGDLYKNMWNNFFNSDKYLKGKQKRIIDSLIDQIRKKVYSKDGTEMFFYYEAPYAPKDTVFKLLSAILFCVNSNRYEFFSCMNDWLQSEYGKDEILSDLVIWNANMIKWLDYTPEKYEFVSKYDWWNWFQTGEIVKKQTVFKPIDTKYKGAPIEWHEENIRERVMKRFLPMCSDDNPFSQLFQELEVS